MSYYSPRFADRLRDMSDDELLRQMKQRFKDDGRDAFFESDRPTRDDTFHRPFSHLPRGFPFDDEADGIFERPRSDGIRAHLDDLAARHPEFAEHLRGPPWPFGSSLLRDRRRRRRGSGGSNNDEQQQQGQQHQVDEDARSQASGSSAASGASAVSSHSSGGEHDLTSSSAIPQYGLRNTMDIGQQQRRRDMETNSEKGERGQRSMSAPPEGWQQQQQGQDQQPSPQQPGQGQRFVSRVDITPQHNQQQQRAQSPGKPTSNVRHIPIFVEGRDTPVMPKVPTDDAPPSTFQHQRQTSPPSHHFDAARSSPPPHHFYRPSHFNERFSRQQWPPSHFQDTFYKPASFEQPMRRQQFQQQQQQPQYYQQPTHHQQQPQYHHQQPQQPQQHHEQHHQQQQQPQYYQEEQQQQQPQQQQQQQETSKPKPPVPKDPLEKVAQVQKEVDDLAEQVRLYVGGASRQDKEYMYLDEMLTRELIKLDDIETEGRENVRQARKNAIKSIQDTISLLETKAPITKQQPTVREEVQECAEKIQRGEEVSQVPEPIEIDMKQEKPSNEPIPLPPAPSSSTKKVENESAATAVESANQNVVPFNQQDIKTENSAAENIKQPIALPSIDESTKCADETSKKSKPSDGEGQKDSDVSQMTNKLATSKQQTKEAVEGKTEVNDGQRSSIESPRLQKKTKKTKKKEQQQQPVSEQAIPLPPPPTDSAK